MQFPYPADVMEKVMPHWLVENYKLLEEKLKDIVLMQRGLLIPHPRDEYDLLEERILESLELKTPRLLKCGHFVGPDIEDEDHEDCDDDDDVSVTDESTGRGSRMSGGTLTVDEDADKCPSPMDDASVCMDCHRQVKKPGGGLGAGRKKWDIKIYAANGLMRAGAWCAAWSEMERCDVEIAPWMPEEIRKMVEKRALEEQEAEKRRQMYAAEVQRRIDEETARLKKAEVEAEENRKVAEVERQNKAEEEVMQQQKFENVLVEKIEQVKETMRLELEAQAHAEASAVAERFHALEEQLKREKSKKATHIPQVSSPPPYEFPSREYTRGRPRSSSARPLMDEIPLGIALKNYITLLLQDQKNLAIIALSVFVLILATNMKPTSSMQLAPLPVPNLLEDLPSVVVTTTATTTAVSIATTTVTKVDYVTESGISERALPPSAPTHSAATESAVSQEAMVHESDSVESPMQSSTHLAQAPRADTIDVEDLQFAMTSPSDSPTVSPAPTDESSTATNAASFEASASSSSAAKDPYPEPLNPTSFELESLLLPSSEHGAPIAVSETSDVPSD
ncbi:hypothetical protein P154DRAFT_524052, partial [Amniculicola lignicola CBS 123094]